MWIYRETRGTVCSSHGACKEIACQGSKHRRHKFSGWIYMLIRERVMDDVFSKKYNVMLQCKNVFITAKSLFVLRV